MDQIPLPVLEKFPNFNARTFQDLKVLYQHAKAKTRLVEKKLVHAKADASRVSADEKPREITHSCANNSVLPKATGALNQQSILSISDDSFNFSIKNLADAESNCYGAVETRGTAPVATREFDKPLQKNNEPQLTDQSDSTNLSNSLVTGRSSESAVQGKKSTFQLKRPIKATVGTHVSKQIGEIWKKEEESKATSATAAVSSLDVHTTANSLYKPGRVEVNKSAYPVQEKRENLQFSENLRHESIQKNWNDTLNTHGKSHKTF